MISRGQPYHHEAFDKGKYWKMNDNMICSRLKPRATGPNGTPIAIRASAVGKQSYKVKLPGD